VFIVRHLTVPGNRGDAMPSKIGADAHAGHTLHCMTNHVICIDGDHAGARSYIDA
jgi:hypothetical protein